MAKKKDREPSPVPTRALRTGAGSEVGLTTLRRILARLDGSRLCFGDPVRTQGVTVIPVARVRAAGGAGFGQGEPAATGDGGSLAGGGGGGGGGGGYLEADPVGFVTVAADGSTHYEAIPDPQAHARTAQTLASAVATLVAALAGARALRRVGTGGTRGRAAALLRRGD